MKGSELLSIDFGTDIYEEPIVAKTFLSEDAQEGSLRPKTLSEYIGQEIVILILCADFVFLWHIISRKGFPLTQIMAALPGIYTATT